MTSAFDFAVIGAGSAGCVVAAELVRAGHAVALVEAGPDYGPFSARWPREIRDPRRRTERHDWGFVAAMTRTVTEDEPRARVFGGCSAHNECGAVWPPAEDLDAWEVPGWTAAELWPLVERIESARGGSALRGRSGPVPTAPWTDGPLAAWQRDFAEGTRACGYGELDDLSAPGSAAGIAPFHANVRAGVRWNASFAFLDPVRGSPRLSLFPRTEALRLEHRAGRVEALVCRRGKRRVALRAARYVLCAGAYGSPLLLLRSGVRRREVGRGLQDHPGVALRFRARPGAPRELRSREVARSQVALRAASGTTSLGWDLHLLPYQAEGEIVIFVFFMAPRSRGLVTRSRDKPRIRFRFFEREGAADLDALVAGVEIAREIARRSKVAELVDPAADTSERALRRWIRANVSGYAHASCTNRMGADARSVVDPRCRVRGFDNLSVADASIFPRIPRANTNMLCMLAAMRATQLLLG